MSKTIGHYEIVSELGRGGMGVVYKAHEQSLGRFVAIKMLGDQVVNDPNLRARFMREARSAASLNHPNIIQIYFVGEDEGKPFFAMEYVAGVSLAQVIRSERQLEPKRAAGILLQAASGLARAHDQGIVHRDIKPGNIMIDEHGHVKLADFGIAYVADVQEKLTATGQFLGTPGYLSPEVCLGKPVEAPADIFSLGIVYYEMLTGTTPFNAESPLAMLREVVESEIPDPRGINPNVDLESHLMLAKMVAKDPAQRYPSCHVLIEDLKRYVRGEMAPVIPLSSMEAHHEAPTPVAPPFPGHADVNAPTVPLTQPANAGGAAELQPTEVITPPPPPPPTAQAAPPPPTPDHLKVADVQPPPRARKPKSKLVPMLLVALLVGAVAMGGWWLTRPEAGTTEIAEATTEQPAPNFLAGNAHEEAEPEAKPEPEPEPEAEPEPEPEAAREEAPQPEEVIATHESEETQPNVAAEPVVRHAHDAASDEAVTRPTPEAQPKTSPQTVVTANRAVAANEDVVVNLQQGQTKIAPVKTELKAEPEPLRPPEKARLGVVASGDRLIARPLRHHLVALLEESGYTVMDEDDLGIDLGEEKAPALRNLGDTVSVRGGDVLVLLQVNYLGSKELNYMGRSSELHRAEVIFKCWFPDGDRKLGKDHREVVEYTTLNAEKKGEQAALNAIDLLLGNMRR